MERKTGLSPRQTEIMRWAAEGLTDKEIAIKMGLSVGTLRSHWDRMRARLGASSRGEVIARAAEDIQRCLQTELNALRHALYQQRTFVWTARPDGYVDYVNDWFEEFSGLDAECLLGKGCKAIMPEDELEVSGDRWCEAQQTATGYGAEVLFRSATGQLVPHQIELSPLQIVDGQIVRWIGVAREKKA